MNENNSYDDISLAAQNKREQYMKEAQDYNLQHQITNEQKETKILKVAVPPRHLFHGLSLGRKHS